MTSQNFKAMPKDRARRANSPAQAIWDCHRGMELVGKAEVDGYLHQHRSGKCKGVGSVPSLPQKGKLPEGSSCWRNGRRKEAREAIKTR